MWFGIASSADGTKLVATVNNGNIYTFDSSVVATTTTAGTGGYLTGGQGAGIELQYIGNSQFLPLSHEGVISGH